MSVMGLPKPWHHFLPLARIVASSLTWSAASHAASSKRQWPMMRGKRHDEVVQLHKKESLQETSLPPNLQLIHEE